MKSGGEIANSRYRFNFYPFKIFNLLTAFGSSDQASIECFLLLRDYKALLNMI